MHIRITEDTADLIDPENMKAFHVVVPPGMTSDALETSMARAELGTVLPDGDHVMVRVDALRRLAAGHVAPGWEDDLAGMLRYATSKGWTDDSGELVRAHITRG